MLLRRDRAWFALSVLLAVARLAGEGGSASARTIAAQVQATPRSLEPLLQQLARAGLLAAQRGPRGGYALGAEGTSVSLARVLVAMGAGKPAAASTADAVTRLQAELEEDLKRRLAALTLADLLAAEAGASVTQLSSSCNQTDTVSG